MALRHLEFFYITLLPQRKRMKAKLVLDLSSLAQNSVLMEVALSLDREGRSKEKCSL
jgi:hypothetical protein